MWLSMHKNNNILGFGHPFFQTGWRQPCVHGYRRAAVAVDRAHCTSTSNARDSKLHARAAVRTSTTSCGSHDNSQPPVTPSIRGCHDALVKHHDCRLPIPTAQLTAGDSCAATSGTAHGARLLGSEAVPGSCAWVAASGERLRGHARRTQVCQQSRCLLDPAPVCVLSATGMRAVGGGRAARWPRCAFGRDQMTDLP